MSVEFVKKKFNVICQGLSNSFREYVVLSQCAMLQVNDHPSGGRSHLCNADRHAKYKKAKYKKEQNTKKEKYNIFIQETAKSIKS